MRKCNKAYIVLTLTALPACVYNAPSETSFSFALFTKLWGNPCNEKASSGVSFLIGVFASSSLLILSDGREAPLERRNSSLSVPRTNSSRS